MKPKIRVIVFGCLILLSVVVLVAGIIAMNGNAINDQIFRFFKSLILQLELI